MNGGIGVKVKRVASYRIAAYPDKDMGSLDRDLLVAIPARWKRSAAACAALTATVALLAACKAEAGSVAAAGTTAAIVTPEIAQFPSPSPTPAPTSSPTPKLAADVPLFEHGVGRGAFGCIMVTPPVFLTEQEAMAVIRDVAEQNGLSFGTSLTIKGVQVPVITSDSKSFSDQITSKNGEIDLDGYDDTHGIAFEFVSVEDVESWRANQPAISMSNYPIIDLARNLIQGINHQESDTVVAVFYDPVTHPKRDDKGLSDFMTDEERLELFEQSNEDLRQQVLDFIAWLKAEGII